MPYIKQKDRDAVIAGERISNAGELNFFLHLVFQEYMEENGESYQTYNDILGVLEAAKLELYRRRVAKYEEIKVKENGDIEFYQ